MLAVILVSDFLVKMCAIIFMFSPCCQPTCCLIGQDLRGVVDERHVPGEHQQADLPGPGDEAA